MKKVLKTTNTIIYSLLFVLLLVSFAIGFVLLCWPLYYLMIDLFNITNLTGVSKADLILSFNELMSCLVFYKEPFSEGVFAFSESGMNHFLDCRILFTLDLVVFAISLKVSISLTISIIDSPLICGMRYFKSSSKYSLFSGLSRFVFSPIKLSNSS